MKKLNSFFALFLFSAFYVSAQSISGNVEEIFSESYMIPADYKLVSVDRKDTKIAAASTRANKYFVYAPEQKAGDMRVFGLNYMMGNPYRWDVEVKGTLFPFDVKQVDDSNTIVVGCFTDSLSVQGQTFYANDTLRSHAFIMSINGFGEVNWVKVKVDSIWNTMATSFCVLPSGNIMVTGLYEDIQSIIWKINSKTGEDIFTKMYPQVRTFASILSINDKVYIAGTAGDFAKIDTYTVINPMSTGYVNFMLRMDTNLSINYLNVQPYITFDFSSHLIANKNSENILWVHNSNSKTQMMQQYYFVFNNADSIIFERNINPFASFVETQNKLAIPNKSNGFFYSFLRKQNNYYIHDISPTSEDSMMIIRNSDAIIYDVSLDYNDGFTIVGNFDSDSLRTQKSTIPNPYFSNNQSHNFLGHYYELSTGVESYNNPDLKIYPNPTNDIIYIDAENVEYIRLYDIHGRFIHQQETSNKIDVSNFIEGMYFMEVSTNQKVYRLKFIKK